MHPARPAASCWDIFCSVVDNFGDIGVCWRLARQLAAEHGLTVRLWVDDMAAFQTMCPSEAPAPSIRQVDGIEVRSWATLTADIVPHDVVVEAFACDPPDAFVAAMAALARKPVWINLEYLSAEDWVEGCHRLSARHPRLPLTRHFFFPGFTPKTGGVLRTAGLLAARDALQGNPQVQHDFLSRLGAQPADLAGEQISLFCYEQAALPALLQHWQLGEHKTVWVADGKPRAQIACWLNQPFPVGARVQRGALTLIALPFLSQPDYDQLLWACDINFVRGEDSFVRAQWAARPLIWHIYPQEEAAHLTKLDAFLDRYTEAADTAGQAALTALRAFHAAWNEGNSQDIGAQWTQLTMHRTALLQHARQWSKQLATQADLARQLTEFAGQLLAQTAPDR